MSYTEYDYFNDLLKNIPRAKIARDDAQAELNRQVDNAVTLLEREAEGNVALMLEAIEVADPERGRQVRWDVICRLEEHRTEVQAMTDEELDRIWKEYEKIGCTIEKSASEARALTRGHNNCNLVAEEKIRRALGRQLVFDKMTDAELDKIGITKLYLR